MKKSLLKNTLCLVLAGIVSSLSTGCDSQSTTGGGENDYNYDILHSMAVLHGTENKLWRNTQNQLFTDPERNNILGEDAEFGLFNPNTDVGKLYVKFKDFLMQLYPNLRLTPTKNYISFKKGNKHNVLSLWPKANSIEVVLHAKLGSLVDNSDIVYDISNRLWSSAQYAFRFDETSDMNIVVSLIKQTYDLVKG